MHFMLVTAPVRKDVTGAGGFSKVAEAEEYQSIMTSIVSLLRFTDDVYK